MTENSSRSVSSWSSCKSAPGRTLLPQLRQVWMTHQSNQHWQWSKASIVVTGLWSATSQTYAWYRDGSAEHVRLHSEERVNNLKTEEKFKSSLSQSGALVLQRSRNARPEAVDWLLQQHHAPTAQGLAAWHGQGTANELQRAELLLININMNPPLLQGQS